MRLSAALLRPKIDFLSEGSAAEIQSRLEQTHDNPSHGKPHRLPWTESIACREGDDGSGETAQVVDRHDDS